MQSLVTRFHTLLLTVTVAITAVAYLRVPPDFAYPAHWSGSTADWLWPRDMALVVAPVVQLLLLAVFFVMGRLFTRNQFSKSQHILDPALTLIMMVVAASQLGLLLTGVGSDLDFIRLTGFGLGALLAALAAVLFTAERYTYAGLRMPWPVKSDRAWSIVHRLAGLAFGAAALGLMTVAWLDPGQGPMILAFIAALLGPSVLAGLTTVLVAKA